jgi:2-oxoisovalerate ferredoxin oxidoreductase gamma subunit
MIEIRIHGRGGQGAVVASELLALAFAREGKFVQAFPSFGPERRSAPLASYMRADDKPIRLRCEIYKPDYVVVLDSSLVSCIDVSSGLKDNGWIIINSRGTLGSLKINKNFQIALVDASAIAARHGLGGTSPIVNTTMVGAFAKVTGLVQIESVIESIKESMTYKTEENIATARESYKQAR